MKAGGLHPGRLAGQGLATWVQDKYRHVVIVKSLQDQARDALGDFVQVAQVGDLCADLLHQSELFDTPILGPGLAQGTHPLGCLQGDSIQQVKLLWVEWPVVPLDLQGAHDIRGAAAARVFRPVHQRHRHGETTRRLHRLQPVHRLPHPLRWEPPMNRAGHRCCQGHKRAAAIMRPSRRSDVRSFPGSCGAGKFRWRVCRRAVAFAGRSQAEIKAAPRSNTSRQRRSPGSKASLPVGSPISSLPFFDHGQGIVADCFARQK